MELCLHQVRGRTAPLSVTLRQCTREEAETVYRLQNEVRAMMPNLGAVHARYAGKYLQLMG